MTWTTDHVEILARMQFYYDPSNPKHVEAFSEILASAVDKAFEVYSSKIAEHEPDAPVTSTAGLNLYGDKRAVLTSPFGPRGSGFHKGVDFSLLGNPTIYCVLDGTVYRAGGSAPNTGDCVVGDSSCGGGWGNFVSIDTAKGRIRYCHLQAGSILVRPGQKIKAGQPLGKEGNTGNSRGDHTHLEVETSRGKVNPVGYIVDAKGFAL